MTKPLFGCSMTASTGLFMLSLSTRRNLIHCLTLACVVLATAASPGAVFAQHATLSGHYTVDRAASDDIEAAIRATVSGMSFIKRPFARSRLRSTNPVGGTVGIEVNPGKVKITFDSNSPMEAPDDGTTVKWTRDDGETFDLSMRWEGETLVHTMGAKEGTRTNRFTLAGETLTVSVSVQSPQLPRALEYKIVYKR
jgi:hypothetical protein